jgi:DNA-binding transcriptional MerR regulator
MTNPQNLRRLTSEQAREIGAKGGAVKSLNKKQAQRFRWLKKKGLTDENVQELIDWMEDGKVAASDILAHCKTLLKDQDPKVRAMALKLMNDMYGKIHGAKDKAEALINIQNNQFIKNEYSFADSFKKQFPEKMLMFKKKDER